MSLTPHLGASTKEAQAGVATDVAIGVAQALHGEPVATAVNASPITKATLNVIQPYFDLCERMGNIGIDLAGGKFPASMSNIPANWLKQKQHLLRPLS